MSAERPGRAALPRVVGSAALAVTLAIAAAVPAGAAGPPVSFRVGEPQRYVMKNGMTVMVLARPGLPLVQMQLQFPAGSLFHEKKFFPGLAYQGAFAAVFSDTDDPKKRQETVVASSTLKWGKPETFGKIVWFANGTRFPPFPEGSRVELAASGASAQK